MHHLKSLCLSTVSQVFTSSKALGFKLYASKDRKYAFRPGDSPTSPLVVAHVDTVVAGGNGKHNYAVKGDLVNSIALDDRLGVACMFDAISLKKPLADCAMLLCDDEEIGCSTAQIFKHKISPNFLVELDRRGTDVVCYEYESDLLIGLLKYAGFKLGSGSFSDICYLNHYGVCGFNIGVGYHQEHTVQCYANLKDTSAQLARLDVFLAKFRDVRLDWSDNYADSRFFRPARSYQDMEKPRNTYGGW